MPAPATPGVHDFIDFDETLTAALVNDFLMSQAVPRFAITADRDAAIPAPVENQLCAVAGVGLQRHDGTDWTTVGLVVSVAGRTGAVVLTKTDVGLANVDNTADLAKPVSTATQAALDAKAPIASPSFTGTITVGGDVALYRNFAKQLRIDGSVQSGRAAATDPAFVALVSGDAANRWIMDATGKMLWGSGGTTGDVNLYRSAADVLKTDDTFDAAALRVAGVGLGTWQTYAPTIAGTGWSLGNATLIEARYCQIGKTVMFRAHFQWGSTTTFGAGGVMVSLPVASRTPAALQFLGQGGAVKQGVNSYHASAVWYTGTHVQPIIPAATGSGQPITATWPQTWAANDTLWVAGTYEAA